MPIKTPRTIFLEALQVPLLYVAVLWLVYWIEITFSLNFNSLGVYPRTLEGLRGVFCTHFIHSNTTHLFNNSIPLLVLASSLFYFYKEVAYKVLLLGAFFTGLGTWVIARDSYHIGASGVVYLLFSFVFFSGVIRRHTRLIALSMVVIFLYGSMVWYMFPIKEGMSWEGHLSGFLIGILFAMYYRKTGLVQKPFQFSTNTFDTLFDADGNFNPPKTEDEENPAEEVL